jgi:hypothetical protein
MAPMKIAIQYQRIDKRLIVLDAKHDRGRLDRQSRPVRFQTEALPNILAAPGLKRTPRDAILGRVSRRRSP